MNIQLDRKQVVIISLAIILAIGSYWIPTPHKVSSVEATPESSGSLKYSGNEGAIAFVPKRSTTDGADSSVR